MVGRQKLGWEVGEGSRAVMLRPGGQQLVQGWVGEAGPLLLMVFSLDRGVELHMLHWVEILVKDGQRLVTSVSLSVATPMMLLMVVTTLMLVTLMVFMVVTSMVLYMVFLVFLLIMTMVFLLISSMVFLLISSMRVLMMDFDWSWNLHKFVLLVDNWLGLNRGTKIWFRIFIGNVRSLIAVHMIWVLVVWLLIMLHLMVWLFIMLVLMVGVFIMRLLLMVWLNIMWLLLMVWISPMRLFIIRRRRWRRRVLLVTMILVVELI